MATKTTTKAAEKPAAAKKAAAPKAEGAAKPNALQQPLKPSEELAAVVGAAALPRGEVVSKVWDYIKKQELQNPEGSSWVSGCWIWRQATRAPTNAPRRALPLLRVLWMNWKNPR